MPRVAFEFLSDRRDLERLRESARFMMRLYATDGLRNISQAPFCAMHGKLASMVGRISAPNWLMTAGPALMLDRSAWLRDRFVDTFLSPDARLADVIGDDSALDELIKERVSGGWHACGTCRMGAASDPDAVVDPETAGVHGVGGLHVVDASVMPVIPRANTNLPVLMLAEKLAAQIAARRTA